MLQDYIESYALLADFGRNLLLKTNISQGLPLISEKAKELIAAHRCSIYIHDKVHDKLWTTLADGIEQIVIDAKVGIAGYTLKNKTHYVSHDPYNDDKFYKGIDNESGYITQNIASVPIFNSTRDVIGIMQLLNKKDGDFSDDDIRLMVFFAHYISGYLELAQLFEDHTPIMTL